MDGWLSLQHPTSRWRFLKTTGVATWAPWRIGAALMEENHVDQRYGSFIKQDLANDHAVVNADFGAMDVVFLDKADPHGNPLGSKGIGELGIRGAGVAVM